MGTSSELRERALRYRALATSGSDAELRAAMKRIAAEFAAMAVAEEISEISLPIVVITKLSEQRSWWKAAFANARAFSASLIARLRQAGRAPRSDRIPAC